MSLLNRLRRTSAAALPDVATPPLHQPPMTPDAFIDARLDPIPLGVGEQGDVTWDPSAHGDSLALFGGNTAGLARTVVEQCRTRGWQVLIAEGEGADFYGFDDASNVSFLGRPGAGFGDPAASRCLAAVVIAHRLFLDRSAGATAAPALLVLGGMGSLMRAWKTHLSEADVNAVMEMIGDLTVTGGGRRCHVLLSSSAENPWQMPVEWAAACTQVHMSATDSTLAMAADAAAVRAELKRIRAGKVAGRAVLAGTDEVTGFQAFTGYTPGAELTGRAVGGDSWERFKAQVSDTAPALHPQLRLDPHAAGFPDIASCTLSELRRLPITAITEG